MSVQIQPCDHPTDDPRWTCSACLPPRRRHGAAVLSAADAERAKEAMCHRASCSGPVYAIYSHPGDGATMLRCRGCDRVVPVARLLDQIGEPGRLRRRYVLMCVWCDQDIRVDRPKPRIPLHESCARRRRQEGR